MNYAEASFDHSNSMNPPSPPLPVYHFQHCADRAERLRLVAIDNANRIAYRERRRNNPARRG